MTHIQDHRRSCHATLSDATVNALIAGAAEPFSFVISNRLSRESLPCFCRSRVPSEGEVEGNLLSRSFHSLSRLSRSRKGFVSGYAFRRTITMHHTDPAPVGRHSESQRPATRLIPDRAARMPEASHALRLKFFRSFRSARDTALLKPKMKARGLSDGIS